MIIQNACDGLIAIVLTGILSVVIKTKGNSLKKTESVMDMLDINYCREYNKSYNLYGYIITLKYGIYSETAKSGRCIFEIENGNGVMEEPQLVNGNELVYFGSNISICLNGTGSICSKAEMDNKKLLVYTSFNIDGCLPEEEKRLKDYQIYFDCDSKAGKYTNGENGVFLDNNASGKEFKTNNGDIIGISPLGVTIRTDKEIGIYKIEIANKNNNKKVVYNKEKEEHKVLYPGTGISYTEENEVFVKCDIAGSYSQRYTGSNGHKEKYFYSYIYKGIYDISAIKYVYVNGIKYSL